MIGVEEGKRDRESRRDRQEKGVRNMYRLNLTQKMVVVCVGGRGIEDHVRRRRLLVTTIMKYSMIMIAA